MKGVEGGGARGVSSGRVYLGTRRDGTCEAGGTSTIDTRGVLDVGMIPLSMTGRLQMVASLHGCP